MSSTRYTYDPKTITVTPEYVVKTAGDDKFQTAYPNQEDKLSPNAAEKVAV